VRIVSDVNQPLADEQLVSKRSGLAEVLLRPLQGRCDVRTRTKRYIEFAHGSFARANDIALPLPLSHFAADFCDVVANLLLIVQA
jgi:hypothetical protein